MIEFLTFVVPPDELDAWLDADARHWTRFLEAQDGFVRKELWRSVDEPSSVHAVIWWESMAQWTSIPQPELDAVVEAMGPHERHADCIAFEVVRGR